MALQAENIYFLVLGRKNLQKKVAMIMNRCQFCFRAGAGVEDLGRMDECLRV